MLVTGLVDRLAKNGRVVMVSSSAHMAAPRAGIEFDNLDGRKGYGAWKAYASPNSPTRCSRSNSPALWARRARGELLHPGVIKTNLGRHMWSVQTIFAAMGPFSENDRAGRGDACLLGGPPDTAAVSGEYFADCTSHAFRAGEGPRARAAAVGGIRTDRRTL
jgi:NAD(P)-dependent dehydrogenase (short-subunit alcohol dehydrogenase family)